MKKRSGSVACGPHEKLGPSVPVLTDEAFVRAAALFRAAGDEQRLRLMQRLGCGEQCVTDLAEAAGTKMSTLSQQLRFLRTERIVKNRREGKHIFYSLADEHIRDLIGAALEHASEHNDRKTKRKRP